jgi:hypothetical protein
MAGPYYTSPQAGPNYFLPPPTYSQWSNYTIYRPGFAPFTVTCDVLPGIGQPVSCSYPTNLDPPVISGISCNLNSCTFELEGQSGYGSSLYTVYGNVSTTVFGSVNAESYFCSTYSGVGIAIDNVFLFYFDEQLPNEFAQQTECTTSWLEGILDQQSECETGKTFRIHCITGETEACY